MDTHNMPDIYQIVLVRTFGDFLYMDTLLDHQQHANKQTDRQTDNVLHLAGRVYEASCKHVKMGEKKGT